MFKYVPRILIATLVVGLSAFAASPPKLDDAIAAQQKRIAERPDDAVVHNDMANLLAAGGRLAEAEAAYNRAIVLAPNAPAVRFNRALLLHQLGRFDEAESDYQMAVEWEPKDAWSHYQLGRLAADRGQKEKAIAAYARAFALDTELALAEVNPHIIDNPWVTESLLKARKFGGDEGSEVPRQYGEGERIAQLLLAKPMAAEDTEQEVEEEEPAAESEDRERRRAKRRGKQSADAESEEEPASRVVNSSSLDSRNSTGQAKPSGPATSARGSSRGVAPQRSPVRVRGGGHQTPQRNPQTTTPPPPARVGGTAPSRAPSLGQTTIRGSVPRYRPSRRSTSSLELKLAPTPAATTAAGDRALG